MPPPPASGTVAAKSPVALRFFFAMANYCMYRVATEPAGISLFAGVPAAIAVLRVCIRFSGCALTAAFRLLCAALFVWKHTERQLVALAGRWVEMVCRRYA